MNVFKRSTTGHRQHKAIMRISGDKRREVQFCSVAIISNMKNKAGNVINGKSLSHHD